MLEPPTATLPPDLRDYVADGGEAISTARAARQGMWTYLCAVRVLARDPVPAT